MTAKEKLAAHAAENLAKVEKAMNKPESPREPRDAEFLAKLRTGDEDHRTCAIRISNDAFIAEKLRERIRELEAVAEPPEPVTNCCGARFSHPGWPDNDRCAKCREHAVPAEPDVDPTAKPPEPMEDGGPAFPTKREVLDPRAIGWMMQEGMTLRAYAAIKLLVPHSGIDLRSPIAKARDEWLASPEGLRCTNPEILRASSGKQFLENRLVYAFLAGADCGAENSDKLQAERDAHAETAQELYDAHKEIARLKKRRKD